MAGVGDRGVRGEGGGNQEAAALGGLPRGEVVGLVLQALEGLGYGEAAAVLEREAEAGAGVQGEGVVEAAAAIAERRRLRAALARLQEVRDCDPILIASI
jgi:hypothetical protein